MLRGGSPAILLVEKAGRAAETPSAQASPYNDSGEADGFLSSPSVQDERPTAGPDVRSGEGRVGKVVIGMIDGARNALGGYLYQIVAGAGLAARAVEVSGEDQGEFLYSLIIEARNSRVLHEVHGEDLVLRREGAAGNSGTAVQFKFSRHGTAEAITPSELRDVLRAFHRSAKAALAEFPVTGYVLVTNRELNEKVREHQGRRATAFEALRVADREWLNVPEGQREEVEKDPDFGSVESAARTWYAVFQNLTVYPRVGTDHWLRALRDYASARGLYDDEFEPALSRLVGDAIRRTLAGAAEFSRAWLNDCLLGFPGARSLRLSAPEDDSAGHAAAGGVRRWLASSLGTPEETLVRREHLDALGGELARRPVVLVLGAGGCGKSTLAAHFLLESARSRFVAAVSARDLRAPWLGQELNAWRDPAGGRGRPTPPAEDVPGRLRHANPGTDRPILLIDVDGLDEQGECSRDEVRALVALCRGLGDGTTSDVALILTSRATAQAAERARRNLIADLFSAEYPGDVEDLFGLVEVGDFTETELGAVLRRADPGVRRRLQAAAGTTFDAPPDTTVAESAPPPGTTPAHPEIVASLRHPVLWGVFSRLSVDDQHRALDGTHPGPERLAETFVERFCVKVTRRRPTLPGERVRRALVQVARRFLARSPASKQNAWVNPAAQLVSRDEATFLFDEAISYGMIREEEPGRWAWRHQFLRAALAAQEA